MIDFPASPTLGQQFSAAGVTWTWDGAKWLPSGLAPTVVPGINDNRICNGDMRIDQRNNGASGTTVNTYTVDRWAYYATQAGKVTWSRNAISGFTFPYGLLLQSSSAYVLTASDYFFFRQIIEADAISDLAWGISGSQPATLSFWAFSSTTGLFGGAINNLTNRSFPFTYSIPAANTWTKIVVPVPADTGGAWTLSGNGAGIAVGFDLGSGATNRGPPGAWASALYYGANGTVSVVSTNAAYLVITGVKLEIGSVATPFNRQSLAKSMADCQRYFQVGFIGPSMYGPAGSGLGWLQPYPVAMRAQPTAVFNSITYTNCSGLTASLWGSYANGLQVITTAAGIASLTAGFTVSAEL